jgi:uncharacterized protein YajQ (UPF0234 family)
MAQTHSFDVVSKVDLQEVQNAVHQATKEMRQRFDFKGSKSEIELNQKERELSLVSEDEYKLKNVVDILQGRLVKRGVALKALSYGKVEEASGAMVRQRIKIQSGIEKERCKEIVKFIKSLKLKVQSNIQDEQVRVSGAKKDDLQEVIEQLKQKDYDFHMEFVNYR